MKQTVIFLNRFFDVLWIPLSASPWYMDFIIISALSALLFLTIFKKTSNQQMMRFYKNKIFGHILLIRLYKDQPLLTLKIVFSILGYQLIYLRYILLPLLVIFVPLLIISVQLNNRYGYTPLAPGSHFIIRARLDRTFNTGTGKGRPLERIRWDTSPGILIETPPLRMVPDSIVLWRAKVVHSETAPAFFRLSIDGAPESVKKRIITAATKQPFSPTKRKWNLSGLFVNNAEEFISTASPFQSIAVSYDRAAYPFLFWRIDPIVLYFIFTLLLGLLFKPMFRVVI